MKDKLKYIESKLKCDVITLESGEIRDLESNEKFNNKDCWLRQQFGMSEKEYYFYKENQK
jgi:hypothetical protein